IVVISPARRAIVAVRAGLSTEVVNWHFPLHTGSLIFTFVALPTKPLRLMAGHRYCPLGGPLARVTLAGKISSENAIVCTSSGLSGGAAWTFALVLKGLQHFDPSMNTEAWWGPGV